MHILMRSISHLCQLLERMFVTTHADGALAETWTDEPSELRVLSVQANPTLWGVFRLAIRFLSARRMRGLRFVWHGNY